MLPATIGPYQIQRELGRGGMGVVYLATDTKLDRQVAIKALPADLAADPDRLARFQREAKILAALNHSNVGGIHGLETADGQQYLVLEYIEGETLADRLASGPLPVADALTLAKQIAEALDAAHEKGIVHRDLKPGNVMVTHDGVVKVLDFGLARTAEGSPSSINVSVRADSPTITTPVRNSPTIPGAIMGTAGYMSPEQARGKPVDKRSDVFSFGCMVYEMLTGAGPFPGETVTDSLGAILHREPDWSLLPPTTPQRVRELLSSCLTKDRKNRLHDIADARLELERAISGHEWSTAGAATHATTSARRVGVLAASAVALLTGGAGWLLATQLARPAAPAPAQVFHVSTTLQSKPEFRSLVGISPDARYVVYQAWPERQPESTKPEGVLVVRRLDRDETIVMDGTDGARSAAISPDGAWVAYSCAKDRAGTKFNLRRVALENGRPSGKPETICDLPQGSQYSVGWASDREVMFYAEADATMYVVPSTGGEARVVLRADRTQGLQGWDSFVPLVPGKSVLATHYMLMGERVKLTVETIDLASGKPTPVLPDAGGAVLMTSAAQGQTLLVAARADMSGLVAARFDADAMHTLGDPVRVWSGNAIPQFSISSSGTLAVSARPNTSPDRTLVLLDEKGQPQPVPGPARAYSQIAVSPDGARVLSSLDPEGLDNLNAEFWVQDLSRSTSTRMPIQGFSNGVVWSNNGQRFAYGFLGKDETSILERSAGGPGETVKMYATPAGQQQFVMPSAWSPDGKLLAIVLMDAKSNQSDVLMLEQEAGGTAWKATPYLNSQADEHALRFSPDGKWVLFCSVESGRHELYAQPFTGAAFGAADTKAGRVQVSTNGHDGAAWWSPDGKELRFIDSDKQVVSVEVKTEPVFAVSLPKVLYSIKDVKSRGFAWTPDGRLMAIQQGESELANRVDLVINFAEEVWGKVGVGK